MKTTPILPRSLLKLAAKMDADEARFLSRLKKTVTGCWEYTGTRLPFGHGQFGVGKRRYVAHRYAYGLFVQWLPNSVHLHHSCGNPPCCNPDHLLPVAPREHMLLTENACSVYRGATHCKSGHEFTSENTRVYHFKGSPHRSCNTCMKVWQKLYHDKKRAERILQPGARGGNFCQRGHEYTPENTIIRKEGGRRCRTCYNITHNRWKRQNRAVD